MRQISGPIQIEEGENLDQPRARRATGNVAGLGKRMAQVTRLPPPAKGHALLIKDDDVRLSAAWQAELRFGNQAHGGDTLILKWREAFSVGNGGRSRATFEPMPPGKYVFRVKTVTPFGEPVGSELALTILIPQPLWKRPQLWRSAPESSLRQWRSSSGRRYVAGCRRELDQAERRRRLERERLENRPGHSR